MNPESLLCLALAGLYLQDRLILVFANELLLVRERQAWTVRFPSDALRIGSRLLMLPNPLAPWRQTTLAAWYADEAAAEPKRVSAAAQRIPVSLCAGATLVLALLLVGVPVSFFGFGGGESFLYVAAASYAIAFAMAGALIADRERLLLTRRQAAALAAEMLLCIPYAANLVQRICLRRTPALDFMREGAALMSRERFVETLRRIDAQIQDEAALLEPATREHEQAGSLRSRIAECIREESA